MNDADETLDEILEHGGFAFRIQDDEEFILLKAPKGMLGKHANKVMWMRDDPIARSILPAYFAYASVDDPDTFFFEHYDVEPKPPQQLLSLAETFIGILNGGLQGEFTAKFLADIARNRTTWPVMVNASAVPDANGKFVLKTLGLGKDTGKKKIQKTQPDAINQVADGIFREIRYKIKEAHKDSKSGLGTPSSPPISNSKYWLEFASDYLDSKFGPPELARAVYLKWKSVAEKQRPTDWPFRKISPEESRALLKKKLLRSTSTPKDAIPPAETREWEFASRYPALQDHVFRATPFTQGERPKYNRLKKDVLKVVERRLKHIGKSRTS